MTLVLGTHTYAASGDALRRQENGVASLRALRHLDVVNVQFTSLPHVVDGVTTLRALDRDSTTVTGRPGARKPLVSDVLHAIWREARQRGADYFGFTNADIIVSQEAIDWVRDEPRDACVLARQDVEAATGLPKGMGVYGADVFFIATDWWPRHHHRFRGYILGEAVWDNVFATVLMCHGNAVIENRRPLVRHEAHQQNWMTTGPFADYQRLLAAYDATYFSLWCKYVGTLLEIRQRGGSAVEEREMARRTFEWPPPVRTRVLQGMRDVKAFLRYRAARLRRR